MPQPKKGPRLGSNPKHQRLMLSGLALSLFEHERIKTTEAKAKELRPYAERLITKAKRGGVHERRQVLSLIEDRTVVHKLFSEIAPRFEDRNGGYTRILKIGPRNGDGAPMAYIELVEGEERAAAAASGETGAPRRRLRRPSRRRSGVASAGPQNEGVASAGPQNEGAASAGPENEGVASGGPQNERDAATESVEETTDESTGDEPVGQPGDADAATSQDEPGPGATASGDGDEESTSS